MARDQMRNLETFKIGSSQVNEFEYQKNRGQMSEHFEQHGDEAAKGAKPMTQAERVKQIMEAAHKKVEKRRKKEAAKSGKSKAASPSGESKETAASGKSNQASRAGKSSNSTARSKKSATRTAAARKSDNKK